MFCIRKVPTMQPPGHFLKKKKHPNLSNGHRALWPKALLENQKMWLANYFKYPQQVKLDVEKYVLNIYFCLWWNWNQMTPNNILCEGVINQLQMEPQLLIIYIRSADHFHSAPGKGQLGGNLGRSLPSEPPNASPKPQPWSSRRVICSTQLWRDAGLVLDIPPAPSVGHLVGTALGQGGSGPSPMGGRCMLVLLCGFPALAPSSQSSPACSTSNAIQVCIILLLRVTRKISKWL